MYKVIKRIMYVFNQTWPVIEKNSASTSPKGDFLTILNFLANLSLKLHMKLPVRPIVHRSHLCHCGLRTNSPLTHVWLGLAGQTDLEIKLGSHFQYLTKTRAVRGSDYSPAIV